MKSKTLLIGLVVIAISALIVGIGITASSGDLLGKHEASDKQSETGVYEAAVTTVTPSCDELLGGQFKKFVSDRTVVYLHQRKIDDAIVEKDYINYQFDKNTKELIKKTVHWRDDLPEHLPKIITREEAESMVEGKIMYTDLWFIDPDSWMFPITPTPNNPCWAVRIADDKGYNINVIIIDAVEGKILGHGVPWTSSGFSFSGPQDTTNCTGSWDNFYQNAESWFNTMGYSTEAMIYPNEEKVKSHTQSNETAVFYEVAHGSSYYFANDCSDTITADEIHSWISGYTKMPFTFLHSCEGMCEVGPGTFSYEFRKGSVEDTVTVGICGIAEAPCNTTCGPHLLDWQDALFNYMSQSWTVKDAFDQACDDYRGCYNESACIRCVRFAGDPNFAVVPVVERGEYCAAESAVHQAGVPDPDEVLNPLRKLRDDYLKDEYVACYYEYSPDLTKAITKDPALAYEAARLLVKYLPMVTHYASGISEETLITRKDVEEIVSFTDGLKRSVSEIKDEIGVERSQEIVEFLDEFKEQVKAFEGKTFSEALRGSIYYEDKQMPDPVKRT